MAYNYFIGFCNSKTQHQKHVIVTLHERLTFLSAWHINVSFLPLLFLIVQTTMAINDTFLPFGNNGQSEYQRMLDMDRNIHSKQYSPPVVCCACIAVPNTRRPRPIVDRTHNAVQPRQSTRHSIRPDSADVMLHKNGTNLLAVIKNSSDCFDRSYRFRTI